MKFYRALYRVDAYEIAGCESIKSEMLEIKNVIVSISSFKTISYVEHSEKRRFYAR